MRCVLGIDIGTSSVKAAAFDRAGIRLALAAAPSPLIRRGPGQVEHDPRQAWRSVAKALHRLWEEGAVRPADVAAVGLSGHFSTVFVDEAGAPVAPCLMWLDSRAEEEARWLADELGETKLRQYLGLHLPLSAAMPPARVLWVARHCPAELARAAWTAQTKDYVGWRLHGRRVSDAHSLMGLVRVPDGRVSPAYLQALGLPRRLLPEVARPWEIVGRVNAPASRATGLAEGAPVVTGWIDALCSMLGTGLSDPDLGFDIAGTSEAVGLIATQPVRARNLLGQLVVPLQTGLTAVYGLTNAGADSLTWARQAWARGTSYQTLLREAEAAPVEPDGPLFLPYLEGERSPVWEEAARGALLGLRRSHGRGHLMRAVLEGVAFSVRHNLDCACRVSGRTVGGLQISGGGALGTVWNQIKADVLGLPMHAAAEPEAGALGAAMLAAIGLGWYPNLEAAVAGMVRVNKTWQPRAELHGAYDRLYQRYLAAYPALKDILHA